MPTNPNRKEVPFQEEFLAFGGFDWAGELPAAGEDLLKAAGQYDAAWQHWLEWGRQLGQGAGVTEAKEIRKLWAAPNRRAAGAEAIRAAAACEQSAWATLGKAVKSLAAQARGRA